MNKNTVMTTSALLASIIAASNLVGCNSMYFVESGALAGFDVQESIGIEFPSEAFDFGELSEPAPEKIEKLPNYTGSDRSFSMRTEKLRSLPV